MTYTYEVLVEHFANSEALAKGALRHLDRKPPAKVLWVKKPTIRRGWSHFFKMC
jgi:hypothetical protein